MPVRMMSIRPPGRLLLRRPSLGASRRLERSLFHDPALVTEHRVTARALPTLVAWGDQDTILPSAHLDAASTHLPLARVRRFPDTGHLPHVERAEEFANW